MEIIGMNRTDKLTRKKLAECFNIIADALMQDLYTVRGQKVVKAWIIGCEVTEWGCYIRVAAENGDIYAVNIDMMPKLFSKHPDVFDLETGRVNAWHGK